MNQFSLAVKRIIDILGGLVGSVFTIIIAVPVGVAIKLDSPGPVFYCSNRVGKNGRPFRMWKFRSMHPNSEDIIDWSQNEMKGPIFKIKNDARITKVGHFIRRLSIDEFPNFFNVVLGDMSLVGTRPPTVEEYKQYETRHKRRLAMKPGVTGMWQVSGRNEVKDFEEIVKLDLTYIDNWNLWLDLEILCKTVGVVLTGRGAE